MFLTFLQHAALCSKIVCSWYVALSWQAKLQQYLQPPLTVFQFLWKKDLTRLQPETFEAEPHHACCSVTLATAARVCLPATSCSPCRFQRLHSDLLPASTQHTVWLFYTSIMCETCLPLEGSWMFSNLDHLTRSDTRRHPRTRRNTHEYVACIKVHICTHTRATCGEAQMFIHLYLHLQEHTRTWIDIYTSMLSRHEDIRCTHLCPEMHTDIVLNFPCG